MSRDNFISDQLVDMRAQLRDRYEHLHHQEHAETAAPQQKSEPAPEAAATEPPASAKYLPTIRHSGENGESDRERRELEGRIIHDQAALDLEREFLRRKLDELEKFSAVLENSRDRLENEDAGRIALDYFAARGRWSAFENASAVAVPETRNSSGEGKGAYWVAGAVLAGSIAVALVLIALFS